MNYALICLEAIMMVPHCSSDGSGSQNNAPLWYLLNFSSYKYARRLVHRAHRWLWMCKYQLIDTVQTSWRNIIIEDRAELSASEWVCEYVKFVLIEMLTHLGMTPLLLTGGVLVPSSGKFPTFPRWSPGLSYYSRPQAMQRFHWDKALKDSFIQIWEICENVKLGCQEV